jgi:VWFA-related protein
MTRRHAKVRVWTMLLCMAAGVGRMAAAQQGSAPESAESPPASIGTPAVPTIQATSRTVVLDVVVTDRDGHPVPGLTRGDFALDEDGKPQTISYFNATANGRSSEGTGPRTILLVDELNTQFTDFAYVRYSVRKLLTGEGQQLEQPTALYDLSNKGLVVLCEYTRNPAAIEGALERRKAVLPYILMQGTWGAFERINYSMWALQQMALANVGVAGRKNIVWISPGFPVMGTTQFDPAVQEKLFEEIRGLSDDLLRARITVYSVDPRGVMGAAYTFSNDLQYGAYLDELQNAGDAAFGDVAVQTLAVQTGGRALYGRNDVDREIATSLADGNTYYTLSYTPKNRDFDGRFRKVKVRVDRPGMRVLTRDGYYALPNGAAAESPAQVSQDLAAALASPLRFGGLSVLSTTTDLSHKPDRARVQISVLSTDLSWHPDAKGNLASTVYLGGMESGKSAPGGLGESFSAILPAGKMPSPELAVTFTLELPVRYPIGELRLAVRDAESGRIGSTTVTGLREPKGPAPFTELHRRGAPVADR